MSPELRARWRLVPRWLFVAVGAAGLAQIGWGLFCFLVGLPDADRPPAHHLVVLVVFYALGYSNWLRAWNLNDETKPWLRIELEEARRVA